MSLIVKIMSEQDLPDEDPRKSHTIYDDIASVTFNRNGDHVFARMYVRDEVKTAEVRGFTEHEVLADVPANAYVMNRSGKTISSFCANPVEETPATVKWNLGKGSMPVALKKSTIEVFIGESRIPLLDKSYSGAELCREFAVDHSRVLEILEFNNDGKRGTWSTVHANKRYFPGDGQRFREIPE